MPRYLIIALILGGALLFVFRIFLKFYAGISGTRSMVAQDFKTLGELVDSYELAPLQYSELDLLSRNHDVSAKAEVYANLEHGQFFSIYEEPIMAFASKEYLNNDRKVAVVKFNKKKYHFDQHASQVTMTLDGKTIGEVSLADGLKVALNGREVHIDADSSSALIPLSVNDKHLLSIATADEETGVEGRMLHKIKEHTDEEGELILMAIAFALANKQI